MHQFRKTIYILISEIEESAGNREAWAVLERSKDVLNKERAATAKDVPCWRCGNFENVCMQYCNQQVIRKLARQVGDRMFEGAMKDMDATLAEITENDNERNLAISRLKRLIRLAKFFP